MSALFRSEDPLQRKEILEKISISENSYYRHRSTLEEFGLLIDNGVHSYDSVVPGEFPGMKKDWEQSVRCCSFPELSQLTRAVEGALYAASRFQDRAETIYIN